MAATPAAHRMRVPRPHARAGALSTITTGALGTAALGVAVGICAAIALAAAERPSFLSGPARHGFPAWMVGPLRGRFGALPASPPALQADLVRVLALVAIAWLIAWWCADRIPPVALWAAVLAAHVVLLLGPPLSLTDIFNYLHYGRMQPLSGLNPYVSLPIAARADAAYPYSN